jgi:hypothetical protein
MRKKSISVVIVTRDDNYESNCKNRFLMCLDSVMNSFCDTKFEIVLVDFNPISKKHYLSNFIKSDKRIRHVIFEHDMHKSYFDRHIKSGAKFIKKEEISPELIYSQCGFIVNWGFNYGIEHAEGEYIVIIPSDIIVNQAVVQSLTSTLNEFSYFHAPVKESEIGTATDYQSCKFNRRNLYHSITGVGCFNASHRKNFNTIEGYLPYLMPRSKGADLFLSYSMSAIGLTTVVLDHAVVDISHPKLRSRLWVNYKINDFDFEASYSMVKKWVNRHRVSPRWIKTNKRPFRIQLKGAKKSSVDRINRCFKDLRIIRERK